MRIGNIDDLHQSKETDNLAALIQADREKTMTKAQKRKNWWHYYKWYVVCGIIILLIAGNIMVHALGIFDKSPDFQIAYVGETELPQDTISALEQAFASLADDFNGDGEIIVKINQYTNASEEPVPSASYYAYASEIALIGDIEDCDSYFFLMEDPERIQKEYQVLAALDGSCPDDADYSAENKVIAWTDSAILSGMELGSYSIDILGQTVTGDNQELLSGLFLGRRCFYSDVTTDNAEACADLWNRIAQTNLTSVRSGSSTPPGLSEMRSRMKTATAIPWIYMMPHFIFCQENIKIRRPHRKITMHGLTPQERIMMF